MNQLTVNNQPNTQTIGFNSRPPLNYTPPPSIGHSHLPTGYAYTPAGNGTLYVQSSFGQYNRPTIPLFVNPSQNRFPMGVQPAAPMQLGNDGSPQGSTQQLQPQFGRTFGGRTIWNAPLNPLYRSPPRYTA